MQIGAAVAALRRQAFVWLLFRTWRVTVVYLIQSASNTHNFLYLCVISKYLHVCVHHFMDLKYLCNLLSLLSFIHICSSNFPNIRVVNICFAII
jgi:hypothetical protein